MRHFVFCVRGCGSQLVSIIFAANHCGVCFISIQRSRVQSQWVTRGPKKKQADPHVYSHQADLRCSSTSKSMARRWWRPLLQMPKQHFWKANSRWSNLQRTPRNPTVQAQNSLERVVDMWIMWLASTFLALHRGGALKSWAIQHGSGNLGIYPKETWICQLCTMNMQIMFVIIINHLHHEIIICVNLCTLNFICKDCCIYIYICIYIYFSICIMIHCGFD